MKKLTLVLLALALAVPVAAEAKQPPGKPKHPKPAQSAAKKPPKHPKTAQAATKNAAWMCKSLRTANASAFATVFGTNHNARNAYGKCVSAHARSKHSNRAFSMRHVTIAASGTVTNAGAAGCQFSASGCTLTSSGTLDGIAGGTFTSTLTIMWTQATSNGSGGFCAPAAGDTTLTVPGLGTLTKHESGTVCEVGATGPNVAHAFTGSFSVTGGTGLFAGASGSGTVTFAQQPGATTALGGTVTATEKFAPLVVHV